MNVYDDWRADGIVDQLPLDEEAVQMCLDELVYSDYGMTMFGVQDVPGKNERMRHGYTTVRSRRHRHYCFLLSTS